MSTQEAVVQNPPIARPDYSLTGANAVVAVEKGLVEADWYQCPVPRAVMRELLVRRDGPAIRDTILWLRSSLARATPRGGCGAAGGRFCRTSFIRSFMQQHPTRAGTNRATAPPLKPIG